MEFKFFTYKLLSFFLTLSLPFISSKPLNPNPNPNPNPNLNHFLHCISHKISSNTTIVFTPNNPSYTPLLQSTLQNLRFNTSTTPKPSAIITPSSYSQVQSTVICGVESGLQIRIRSGGHDYEGLSYTSFVHSPFVVLDLNQLRSVTVDLYDNTAWVQSGATLGELSYWVSRKSNVLGFPTGECTSVAVGGQLSGGGFGVLARKYGLSADNVVDAVLVGVDGRIKDRESMGEDLFWAIRGGGGGSFGVVVAWKINLVQVPPLVTVFSLSKPVLDDENTTKIIQKWQYIAYNLTKDLFINVIISPVSSSNASNQEQTTTTMVATFNAMFLGTKDKLITILDDQFPELGVTETVCKEMSWVESVVYHSVYLRGQSVETLIQRLPWPKSFNKFKSDYVKDPISEETLEQILKWCLEENVILAMEPHGGRMSEVEESQTPYPHRKGVLYIIQYIRMWDEEGDEVSEKNVEMIRRVYEKMTPFVSKNPREAYVNFRDLDLGTSGNACSTSYLEGRKWGVKYFKGNFRRLAIVKGKVDPTNFFCNEQSIPPFIFSHSYE